MDASLNIAIAAEFDLCEKIAEALEQSELDVGKVSIVEIYPFEEEQAVRFRNKAVAQLATDEIEWDSVNYLFFAGQIDQAPLLAQAAESGCVVIDLKGICSALSDVPVVVPTINEENLTELRQRNIVSLPDQGETRFAFDVFPQQAANLNLQLQKIFPQLDNVIFHQIQVPVFYGMAQKVTALSDYEFDYQPQQSELIELHDSLVTPVINGENENGEESVKLHLSQQSAVENGIEFWTVADEQRFNIALLGVKLLESIYHQGY